MKKMTSAAELREYIFLLEARRTIEKQLLKDEFKTIYEGLQPVNLIKNTLSDLTIAPNFKGNILNAVVSLAAGYFSKKIAVGATNNPLKQLLGVVLQFGVTSVVSENSEGIKAIMINLLSKFLNKKETTS